MLTVYELIQGEGTVSQGMFMFPFVAVAWLQDRQADLLSEWHGMDPDVMFKSLNVLVKRGKAQIFGSEGQEGVKFF